MTHKVILVLIDGLHYGTACSQMGYLHHLVENHLAARLLIRSELPSLSRPLYEVLLTGTPPSVNGITCNHFQGMSSQESLFHLTRRQGLRNGAAAFYWISELYNRYPFDRKNDRFQGFDQEAFLPIQHGCFYHDEAYPDSHVFADGELLRRLFDPAFLLIHPMGVDHAGHLFGADSKEYRGQVIQMDGLLAEYAPRWLSEGYQVLVTSDHGMNRDGCHGGTGPDERQVPLFAIGSAFRAGRWEEAKSQLIIAPLLCTLLGIAPADGMMPLRQSDLDFMR
ncbi:alkaline phosphatase family protein [Heliomicrobium gestii]|uniref:alkaline phosphatase family protein n=1 Tax=Heliomicrobium gestii TaxID=2699 RepID=UPI0019589F36|nr:alkaline phosphatase family protein [Heliomicrobium gestii]MBM7867416.1 putative AlkP superfamily pyrophosphatase or phosphodiesterase [Heliomicrobium gestii]